MKHFASTNFWYLYRRLPPQIRSVADKNFELLKDNPRHPSLHLKKIGNYFSVRIGLAYRGLGVEVDEGILWFWIRLPRRLRPNDRLGPMISGAEN